MPLPVSLVVIFCAAKPGMVIRGSIMSMIAVGPQPVEVAAEDGSVSMVLYGDGRTKQAFKDQTDINKILQKAQQVGSLSHLVRHGAHYGDYSDVPDLLEAHKRLKGGQAIFDELPSELRREFPDQFAFFSFVNDPANADRLKELLPQLAQPGRQLRAVRRSAATEAHPAMSSASDSETPPASSELPSEPSSSETPPSSTT